MTPKARLDEMAKTFAQAAASRDSSIRVDTAGVFFLRQLEDIEAAIKDTKYAQLKTLEHLQLLPGLDPLAERHTFRMRDWVGKAKRSTHPTDSAPTVNVLRKETSTDYYVYKQAFEYSIDELRKSVKYGENLDRERAEAARISLAQTLDDLLAVGDSETGSKGLLNLASTQSYSVPTTGSGSSPLWTAKTPDQILVDMNGIVSQIFVQSLEIESAKRMVLPTALYRLVQTLARSDRSDLSVLEYFKRNNPGIDVLSWERLGDSSASLYGNSANGTTLNSGNTRIIAGDFSVLNVRGLVPVELEMMEPERQGEGYKITLRMKTGGTEAPFPKAICYADGC